MSKNHEPTMQELVSDLGGYVQTLYQPLLTALMEAQTAEEAYEALYSFISEFSGTQAIVAGGLRELHQDLINEGADEAIKGRVEDLHTVMQVTESRGAWLANFVRQILKDRKQDEKTPALKLVKQENNKKSEVGE